MSSQNFRIGISAAAFFCLVIGISVLQAIVPARSASYVATVPTLTDQELLKNYHEESEFLKNYPQVQQPVLATDEDVVQLPVYRIPLFKEILNELKKRNLISADELAKAEALVHEKEAIMLQAESAEKM